MSHLLDPRPSPLFPYTTLFRSRLARVPRRGSARARGRASRVAGVRAPDVPAAPPGARVRAEPERARSVVQLRAGEPVDPARGDRKSTRLNSSHVEISYAVFCLK